MGFGNYIVKSASYGKLIETMQKAIEPAPGLYHYVPIPYLGPGTKDFYGIINMDCAGVMMCRECQAETCIGCTSSPNGLYDADLETNHFICEDCMEQTIWEHLASFKEKDEPHIWGDGIVPDWKRSSV